MDSANKNLQENEDMVKAGCRDPNRSMHPAFGVPSLLTAMSNIRCSEGISI